MADDLAKRRLGRGLATLIGANAPAAPPPEAERGRGQRRVPTAYLRANPHNPRKTYDADDLADLTSSIREKGIVQPILVRPVAGTSDFEIIAGERRWRAAQKAGLHEVPIVVHEVSDREALEIAIIENVQRADLNPLEEALGYQQLLTDHQYTQQQLADAIGKSRPHIANTLRLLNLPEAVREYLREGKLTAGHARALIGMDDPAAAARRIVEGGLSVREAEAMGEAGGKKPRKATVAKTEKDADTRALEKQLSDALGLAVAIDHKPDGGRLEIRYKTLEQLDDICRRLRIG
ncbi:MAG: ParB/RepB/Spo0J family partition protein [Rhizobiales bacterium]|nr:ParB/RepB/Spo0J family partition protein [Hyphomicrobiales bacterium]